MIKNKSNKQIDKRHRSSCSKIITFRVPNSVYFHEKIKADLLGLSVNKFFRLATVNSGKINNLKLKEMSKHDRNVIYNNQKILKTEYGSLMSKMSDLCSQIKRIGVNIDNYIHSYFRDRNAESHDCKAGKILIKSPNFDKVADGLQTLLTQQMTVYQAADSKLESELTKLWQLLQ